MSIPVPVEELAETVARYGPATILLTVNDELRSHATNVTVTVEGAVISCGVGRRTTANLEARPLVSFLWPPPEPGGYSLIADGEAMVEPATDEGGTAAVTITKAVLHRPATTAAEPDAACGSDCLTIEVPES